MHTNIKFKPVNMDFVKVWEASNMNDVFLFKNEYYLFMKMETRGPKNFKYYVVYALNLNSETQTVFKTEHNMELRVIGYTNGSYAYRTFKKMERKPKVVIQLTDVERRVRQYEINTKIRKDLKKKLDLLPRHV